MHYERPYAFGEMPISRPDGSDPPMRGAYPKFAVKIEFVTEQGNSGYSWWMKPAQNKHTAEATAERDVKQEQYLSGDAVVSTRVLLIAEVVDERMG